MTVGNTKGPGGTVGANIMTVFAGPVAIVVTVSIYKNVRTLLSYNRGLSVEKNCVLRPLESEALQYIINHKVDKVNYSTFRHCKNSDFLIG